jgi:proteasome accessory factor B
MNLKRVHRLIKLISLLQGGRGHNVTSLARECQVTRRTIFRDLDALKQAGIPLVYYDPDQTYRLAGSHLLPPTNLSPQEALSIVVLCHELGADGRLPFHSAARSAALKIENSLPMRLREELRGVVRAVKIRLPQVQHANGAEGAYERILQALGDHQAIHIDYDSFSDGERIATRLSPYQLLFHNHSWYVIGRSSLHAEVRTFNVARIREYREVNVRYEIPRNFSLERYLGNAWRLIRSVGPDVDVHIRFQPLVARNVAEVLWHRTQQATLNGDGTLDFRVKVSGIEEISWWILGYGDQAEVIAPSELRQLLVARIQSMARVYGLKG